MFYGEATEGRYLYHGCGNSEEIVYGLLLDENIKIIQVLQGESPGGTSVVGAGR